VAAALEMDGGIVRAVRLAMGGVAHKPWRRREAEAVLVGRAPDAEQLGRAADVLLEGAEPLEHNAFKPTLARRAIVRALTEAARS